MEAPQELNFLSALLPFAGIVFIIAIGVVLLNQQFQKNLFRQQLLQEEMNKEHQLELLRSSITVQEEERKRIARDLHDELGAVLSISRMHLLQLEEQDTENNKAALQNIRSLTENALASMRRISHDLVPVQLENFGLLRSLEAVARQINSSNSLQLQLQTAEELPELSWAEKLGLYRILMEFLNNTMKHAAASQVQIKFYTEDSWLCCHYTDNGKGVEMSSSIAGIGLKSVEGRARALSGEISLDKPEIGGFSALIKIPLKELI